MKTIAIILGYQLNLDSTMDPILVHRLDMGLKLLKEEKIDKIIVTGGRPREEVLKSEAEVMYEYLVEHGVSKDMIIKEETSKSTFANAKYSVPIVKELKADRVIIVTTIEHFLNYDYNPLKLFSEFINDDSINLMVYTNTIPVL